MKVTRKSARVWQGLVVLLALALVCTAVPAVVLNGAPQAAAAEVSVGSESQLAAAFADPNTTKITLTNNITLSGYGSSYNNSPRFTVPNGSNIELNLNGKKISWSVTDANQDLLCSKHDDNATREAGGYKYVLIQNNGTLNVTGSGTIEAVLQAPSIKNTDGGKTTMAYTGGLATIRTAGTLTTGSGVAVKADLTFDCPNNGSNGTNDRSGDTYMTAIAIYQTGGLVNVNGSTIRSNAHSIVSLRGGMTTHIESAGMIQSYGIYSSGGVVNCLDATVVVDAYGAFQSQSGETETNCMQINAVGIYTVSSDTQIIGTDITATSVIDDDISGSSGSGGVFGKYNCTYSAYGVMYTGNVTPTIGVGTNITANAAIADNGWSGGNPQHLTRAVTQSNNKPLNTFDTASTGASNWDDWNAYTVDTESNTVTSYKDESGNVWTPGTGENILAGGIPNQQVSSVHKVVIVYRYYDTSNELAEVVTKTADVADKANAISLTNVSNGLINLSTASSFTYTSGGSPKNSYFYKLDSITCSAVASGNISSTWVKNKGGVVIATANSDGSITTVNPTVSVSSGNTTLVYVDFYSLPVDTVRANLNNSSQMDDTNTVAEVEYMGKAPVFGQDIIINVYKCMRQDDDPTAQKPYANDINITDRFDTVGSGYNLVTYDVYDSDSVKVLTNSLPTNPGTYTVKMKFPGETTYNSSAATSMNFGASTFDFTLIIRPRNVKITQTATPELTYGQTLDTLKTADLNNYFTIETGVAGLSASGTFEWVTPSEMPEVGERTYQLKWFNSQGLFETQVLDSVKVKVNRAPLTVTAKNKTVTYGEALNISADDFVFAGLADKTGEAELVFNQIKDSVKVDGADYVPGSFDAGSHSYQLTTASTTNYTITNNAGTLTIAKAPLTIKAPAVTKEYDGLQTCDIVFDASCIVSGLHDVYGAAGVVIDPYIGAPLANGGAVGSTTATVAASRVTLSGAKAGNYTVGAVTNASSVQVNVVKASPLVDKLVIADTEITYDPTRTLSKFSNLTPDTENGYIKVISAGDTLADGRAATPGKWVWKTNEKPTVATRKYIAQFQPDDANYAAVDQEIEVVVNPRVITVGVSMADVFYGDDQPSGTYTFSGFPTGSEEKINVKGSTFTSVGFELSGNLFYACDYGKDGSKNAGTYPITVTSSLTADNYRFVVDTSCSLLVKPKDLIITPDTKTVTYGSTLQQSDFSFTMTGLVAGDEALQATLNPNYAYDVGSTTDVGEYPLTVTFANTLSNYNFSINPGKIVVTKALVTVQADDVEVTYGGTPVYTFTYQGFKGTDGNIADELVTGTPTFSTSYSTSSKAGETFSIIVGVNGLSAKNYAFKASDKIATLTVTTGKVNVTAWPVFEVENGKTLANAVVSSNGTAVTASDGKEIAGTFRIDDRDAELEYKNNGTPINRVAVTFYPTDTNYESVQGTAEVTVLPRAVSGQPTIQGTLMVGEKVSLDVSTLNPSSMTYYDPSTIQWAVGGTTVATGMQSYTLTADDEGKTVTVVIAPYSDSGFTGSASYTTTIRVSPALPIPGLDQLTIPTDTVTVTYDKQPHKFTVSKADQNIGDLTIRYNGANTAPSAAGTYIVTVDIGTSNSGQYAPVSGLKVGTLVIEPRPIKVTFTAQDKTYDGKTNAVVSDFDASVGIISGDNVSVNRSAATYDFVQADAADGVEVVMSYAYLEGTAKDNYFIQQETVYANIFPKDISAVAYAAEQDYDENNYTVHLITFGTPTGVLAADKNSIVLNSTTGTMGNNAAGSQDVTYVEYDGVLAGAKASNYTFSASNENTLKVNILQVKEPGMEYPTAITVSYSSLQRLEDLAAELPFGWTWDDPTIVPTVRVKMYNATYTPANPSYKTESYKVVVNVTPVEVNIIPENYYLTYGDPVPTLAYTMEGFTGEDDVTDCSGMIIIQTNYAQGDDITTSTPYRIWVSGSTIANPNYTFYLKTEGAIYVDKRDYYVTPSADEVVYDPNNHEVTVHFEGSGAYVDPVKGPDSVELSFTESVGTLDDNNAGSRLVSYTLPGLIGAKAGNYELKAAVTSVRVQVLKADPVVTFPTSATVEYGQKYSTAVFDGGVGEGSFLFVDSSKVAADLTNGYYDVKFTPTDSRNYNSVIQPVLLQVTTSELKMSASISGTLYEGQTLTAAVAGVPQDALQYLHYAWYRVSEDGTAVLVSDASTYELGASDIGYYIRMEVSTDPTAPYSGSASFTTVRPVEEEKLTFWQKLMKWWYSILAAIQSMFDTLGKR